MFRRATTLALAVMIGVFAVFPHKHDVGETLFAETTHLHDNGCDRTNIHFEAAHIERHHACVACARQHHAGTPELVPLLVARDLIAPALPAAPVTFRRGAFLSVGGRSPPPR